MAKADLFDFGHGSISGEDHHAHWVGVIEHSCAGGEVSHVAEDVEVDGNGAHSFHESAWAEGIADVLADSEFERDVVIESNAFGSGDFDGVDDIVDSGEEVFSVGAGTDDPFIGLTDSGEGFFEQFDLKVESGFVDVAESEFAAEVVGNEDDVAEDAVGEEASGSHHKDIDLSGHGTRKTKSFICF